MEICQLDPLPVSRAERRRLCCEPALGSPASWFVVVTGLQPPATRAGLALPWRWDPQPVGLSWLLDFSHLLRGRGLPSRGAGIPSQLVCRGYWTSATCYEGGPCPPVALGSPASWFVVVTGLQPPATRAGIALPWRWDPQPVGLSWLLDFSHLLRGWGLPSRGAGIPSQLVCRGYWTSATCYEGGACPPVALGISSQISRAK